MTDVSFYIVWHVFMAFIIVYLVLVTLINRRLQFKHTTVWDAQGRPTFWNNSPANNIRFVRYFVFASEYKSLSDQTLVRLVLAMRILFICCAVLFVAVSVQVFRPAN